MKRFTKLFILGTLILTMSGCGNTTNNPDNPTQTSSPNPSPTQEQTTKTRNCTLINTTTNLKKEFMLTATDEVITEAVLKITYDNQTLAIDDFSTFTDDQKEQYKDNMLNNMGLDESHYEGLDITFDFDKQLSVTFTADVKEIDPTILDQVGINIDIKNVKLTDAVDLLEDEGATCN